MDGYLLSGAISTTDRISKMERDIDIKKSGKLPYTVSEVEDFSPLLVENAIKRRLIGFVRRTEAEVDWYKRGKYASLDMLSDRIPGHLWLGEVW